MTWLWHVRTVGRFITAPLTISGLHALNKPVPRMGIHGLRHTHATALIAQGVPVNVVSERQGHAEQASRWTSIIHSNQDQQRKAADTFAASILEANAK
jgi:integrase